MDKVLGFFAVLLIAEYVWNGYKTSILTLLFLAIVVGGGGTAMFFLIRHFHRRDTYDKAIQGFHFPETREFIEKTARAFDVPVESLSAVARSYDVTRNGFVGHWNEYYAVPRYDRHNFKNTVIGAQAHIRDAGIIHEWYTALAHGAAFMIKARSSPGPAGITHEERVEDPAGYIESIISKHRPSVEAYSPLSRYLPAITGADVCGWTGFDGVISHHALELKDDVRFEHQWVVAPSGAGKTTLLQTQIADDLRRVARGECSVIIIDSQNQLIGNISRCGLFAPGQPLHGKLVLLEPDPEHPPALNVLDVGTSGLNDRERFIAQAEAIENVKSCLSTMNDMQDDLLSYMVEFCFVIPGATIQTLVDLLKPDGLRQYAHHLPEVDQTCRDFFETSFDGSLNRTTKEAVSRRLLGMLRNPTFRRMFLNPQSRFSMARELREPKVILINTDLNYLKKDACQLFGRFFIAQLLQAAGNRGASDIPVFCYVDECHDYIADDDNAATLLDKARKRKVGMILAHQRMANIHSANVIDALSNVGVRMAGGNETDAPALSRIFRCPPEFIRDKERGRFAFFARRQTPHGAIEIRVPPDALESLGRMSDCDHEALRKEMRRRFAAPLIPEHTPVEEEPRARETPIPHDGADWTGPVEDATPPEAQIATPPTRRPPPRPPVRKVVVTPKRSAPVSASPAHRRRKVDAPDASDTTGSKPTAEW